MTFYFKKGRVFIAVEDKSRGISKEIREKVFNKFFRAAANEIHTAASGLGLGLAIAWEIVESQGEKSGSKTGVTDA